MKRIVCAFAVIVLSAVSALAQDEKQVGYYDEHENVFDGRVGVTLGYKPVKGLDITLSEELRASTSAPYVFDRTKTTLDITYSPFKRFDIIAEYSYVGRLKSSAFKSQHRGSAGLAYTFKMGDFRLQLRELVQCNYSRDSVNVKEKANPALYLRSRVKLSYKMQRVAVTPYVAFELYNSLNAPYVDTGDENTTKDYQKACAAANVRVMPFQNYINRYRASAGVKYDFNAHTALRAYYLFDDMIEWDVNYGHNSGKINRIVHETTFRHTVALELVHYF